MEASNHIAKRYCRRKRCADTPNGECATAPQAALLALVTKQHRSEQTRLTRLQTKLTDFKNSSELRFIELCQAIQRSDN
jgi:hypothetical protein